jgi:putative hydroxymethylpyrimidine transport system ATP-binding protein
MAPGIRVRHLSLRFGARTIFSDLSFDIAGGHWVSLLGASGAGKPACCELSPGWRAQAAVKSAPAMVYRSPTD